MNFNISLPCLETFNITDSIMKDGIYQLHMELERCSHLCPSCNTSTSSVHDYRTKKIQHTKIFSRETILFYRKRRYVCNNCKKR